MLAGLFGLAGSVIGGLASGLASYWGSERAAKDSINAHKEVINEQKEKEKEEQDKSVRTSARIIIIDTFTAVREIIRIRNQNEKPNVGRVPENISTCGGFSMHIENLSENLTFDELVLINKLYGLMDSIKHDISTLDSLKQISYNKCKSSADILGLELFGEKYFNIAKVTDYRVMNYEVLIDGMEHSYKNLFGKIHQLAKMHN